MLSNKVAADKTTLVYGLPLVHFREVIPGWIPSEFKIDPPAIGDITVKVIEGALFHLYLDSDRGAIPQERSSKRVAEEIYRGYTQGGFETIPGIQEPLFFFVEGEWTKEEIKETFKDELRDAEQRQNRWFVRLVELSDDIYKETRKHKSVPNVARVAARVLGQEREWMITPQESAQIKCPSCNQFVSDQAVVCGFCKYIINMEKFDPARYAGAIVNPKELPQSLETEA